MWKTSTLQQFLEWNLHFHVNTQRACVYQQYYFIAKMNYKKQSKRSRADILLQEITSWSHNLWCFTNYWVFSPFFFFFCVGDIFLVFKPTDEKLHAVLWLCFDRIELQVKRQLISTPLYCCRWFSPWMPIQELCARTQLPVHLHPHLYPGFDFQWTLRRCGSSGWEESSWRHSQMDCEVQLCPFSFLGTKWLICDRLDSVKIMAGMAEGQKSCRGLCKAHSS